MKGIKQIALRSNVMDFRNNAALSIPNCNNTLLSSWLLAASYQCALEQHLIVFIFTYLVTEFVHFINR